jgi:hypothetical protein
LASFSLQKKQGKVLGFELYLGFRTHHEVFCWPAFLCKRRKGDFQGLSNKYIQKSIPHLSGFTGLGLGHGLEHSILARVLGVGVSV